MSIAPSTLNEIAQTLTQFDLLSHNPVAILKGCFPGLTILRCALADMSEPPYRALEHFNLYLLDGREHCVELTHDPERATGVLIATR